MVQAINKGQMSHGNLKQTFDLTLFAFIEQPYLEPEQSLIDRSAELV
jgi:hypothetical protein